MADFTPQEQEEFEFRLRMEQEQEQAQRESQQNKANSDSVVEASRNVIMPAAGAAIGAGSRIGEKIADVGRAFTGQENVPRGFYGRGATPVERYGRSQNVPAKWLGGGSMEQAAERISRAFPVGGPITGDPAIIAQMEKEALEQLPRMRRTGEKMVQALPSQMKGVLTSPFGMLGKGLLGAGVGMQGADALNRWDQGDTSGAVISGLGALGTGISMIPHPVARIGGTAVGLGAEGLNMFLDKLKNKNKPQMAEGGLVDRKDGLSKAEKAALHIMNSKKKKAAHLKDGGQPPKSEADEGKAFIGYPHINKNRKIGSGTGFLDAVVGAPPSRENVLNPVDASYMEGYEKGEPYGIAGMVLPFAGGVKNAISRAMPPKLLKHADMQFLHGTSPAAKAEILASGKFDPHPARWPSYSYSEVGADTTYATPKEGWWLDKQKAISGRAQPYESAVGVTLDPSAKIAHIRGPKDWEKFARHTGFESGQDLYSSLQAENLDAYNYAKNLTPKQYDQLQMERIQLQKWLNRNEKPGDFHYTTPEQWNEWIEKIPASRERALNERSITEPRAAVQKIKDKGYHGLYVDKHDEMGIPAPEQLAIFDQSMIKPNADIGYKNGGSVPHFQAGKLVRAGLDFVLPAAENAARTQIIGTLPTYRKAAEMLGNEGRAIDFGAGLGKGADLLGPGTHTYEPFAQNWNPTYTNAADIPSDAYGRLTNLNVLNVVPREARDEIIQHIGRVMEPGGRGIITTRGADVMKAKGEAGPEPMSIITSRDTYQKGFTKPELEDYIKYMLGNKFDINKINLGPAGVMIEKKKK